jgi:hypothetical protein
MKRDVRITIISKLLDEEGSTLLHGHNRGRRLAGYFGSPALAQRVHEGARCSSHLDVLLDASFGPP